MLYNSNSEGVRNKSQRKIPLFKYYDTSRQAHSGGEMTLNSYIWNDSLQNYAYNNNHNYIN